MTGNPLEKPKEEIFPAHVHGYIRLNDLDTVVFKDPFSEATRRTKRNLIAASFVAILVAALQLRITGFLGLSASGQDLGNDVAQGLAWMVVLYTLAAYLPQVFVDYVAWAFERERRFVTPYLEFLEMLERRIEATRDQIGTVQRILTAEGFKSGDPKLLEIGVQNIDNIARQFERVVGEVEPLLQTWASFVQKARRLDTRLRVRFGSLWLLDIAFPIGLSGCALVVTWDGVRTLVTRLIS